ncbi:SprB repeat-containing protein, partial [Spirosoma sp. 48-14]|uniref:SprB repeat-containing protein n=1 Tax=Spirosoma sp. 48-14 TaxID=1895854 RepID=UPI000AEDEB4B
GSVSAQVSGGSPAYSYQWRNAAGSVVATSQTLTNASPGSYTVIVTDATGCTALASANISNLSGPQVSGVPTNVKCYGTQTGGVVLTVTGGTPPIGYVWSNGSTSKDLSNVGAGVYTVTARDANGCVAIQSFTISQPTEIVAVFQASYPTCTNLTGGSVNLVSISGGTTPYSYTWSNGSTASSISGLSGGTYTLTIKDANGCIAAPIAVLPTPTNCTAVVCEKPVLSLGDPACTGNGYYSVLLITSTTNIIVSDGVVSGQNVINIPIGKPISVTASNGVGCYNVLTADSPTGCSNNGNNNCTPPRLSVGQPLCQGTGFYTVSYRLVGTGSV